MYRTQLIYCRTSCTAFYLLGSILTPPRAICAFVILSNLLQLDETHNDALSTDHNMENGPHHESSQAKWNLRTSMNFLPKNVEHTRARLMFCCQYMKVFPFYSKTAAQHPDSMLTQHNRTIKNKIAQETSEF